MPEPSVSAFFPHFLHIKCRNYSFGVFFPILHIKMPESLVPAFFFSIIYIKMPESLVPAFFFNYTYKNAGIIIFGGFFSIIHIKMPEL
jgi:hypothetical protein